MLRLISTQWTSDSPARGETTLAGRRSGEGFSLVLRRPRAQEPPHPPPRVSEAGYLNRGCGASRL
jgi:hypothetical protein